MYTYIVMNCMEYGVLISYDVSFLKREAEDADDGAETLLTSDAIYLQDSACPILACVAPAVSPSTTPDVESTSHVWKPQVGDNAKMFSKTSSPDQRNTIFTLQ